MHLFAARCTEHVDLHGIARVRPEQRCDRIAVRERAEHVRVDRATFHLSIVDECRPTHVARVGHGVLPDPRIVVGEQQREVAVVLAVRDVDIDDGSDVDRVRGPWITER